MVVGHPNARRSNVIPSGNASDTWAGSTTDVRALQKAAGSGRIAATWSSGGSSTVDVNLTDGQPHDLGLYFVDWDTTSRAERVRISGAATVAVLSTPSVSSSHSGVYLDDKVSGHSKVTMTRTGGTTAVLSGSLLDPMS